MNFMNRRSIILGLSGVVCFALFRMAQAVVPAPDGGYPGNNTAEGQDALFSRTSGVGNTALGANSLYNDTTGYANTAVGLNAMRLNVTGAFNTAVGLNALYSNNGDPTNSRASDNCAIGALALFANTTGYHNCALGFEALALNTTGADNTANGAFALFSNTIGASNTAIGEIALNHNMTGSYNTAIGLGALVYAGGNRNTAVGSGAADNVMTANNVICIGQGVGGADVSDSCYIGNIWNQPGGSQAVYVNSDGKLGFATSSRRFKDDIKPMAQVSEVIYALKPVSFRYRPEIEPTRPRGFGLIAEEVEKLSPDLVTRGADGKVNSVRYDQVNAMLLNEFLKEHRKVEAQQGKIEKQEREMQIQRESIAQLKWTVAQQEKQFHWLNAGSQRVTARVEIRKDKPKMALNNW
jgi:Chaperone of endosialidase